MKPVLPCPRWRPALAARVALVALAGVGLAGPAAAVLLAGPGGSAEQGRRLVQAAPVDGAEQPAQALLAGRIEAVDAAGRWLQLQGQQLALHPTALRVLGPRGTAHLNGQPARGVADLRPGQAIRFAMEALPVSASPAQALAAPGRQRIVLILLDAQP